MGAVRSRVLTALRGGGTVDAVSRRAAVDPDLVRIALDHAERLGQMPRAAVGCGTGSCAALHPDVKKPLGCAGCPLVRLGPARTVEPTRL